MTEKAKTPEGWRFAKETEEQRIEGWSLREQLLWRVGELTSGQSIDLAGHAEQFPELIDGYTLNRFTPILHSEDGEGNTISKASLEDGGSLRLTGSLHLEGEYVALFMRRLQFDQDWAIHEHLAIDSKYRAYAIGPRFVHRSLELYDALELESVKLRAGLETGRWYWAHMGFDFAVATEVEKVRDWAEQMTAALGIEIEGLEHLQSAPQFARLQGAEAEEVCFNDLIAAIPERRASFLETALGNGIPLERKLPLGKLLMLTGPRWDGQLSLRGAQRRGFEAAVAERSAKAQRRAESALARADGAEKPHPPLAAAADRDDPAGPESSRSGED